VPPDQVRFWPTNIPIRGWKAGQRRQEKVANARVCVAATSQCLSARAGGRHIWLLRVETWKAVVAKAMRDLAGKAKEPE
jgi:hypothetical protein